MTKSMEKILNWVKTSDWFNDKEEMRQYWVDAINRNEEKKANEKKD